MPIIIDNFFVNTDAPIDNRFVVGPGLFYLTKDDINYKYVGLRVWDSNNNVPYYWDGTQWLSENSVGVLADTSPTLGAESDYIPKFTSGPTVIGKSIIYQSPSTNQIGIGLVGNSISANVPGGTPLVNGLHVAGNIRTNASFVGSGLHVTDINASNINSGLLSANRIAHYNFTGAGGSLAPNQEYVLFNEGNSGSVRWRVASGLSVLNSTNTTNVNISENSSSSFHYITFVNSTSGQLPLRINSSKMQFRPNTGQLFLSDGSPTDPVYSFLSNLSTGFYYSYSGNGNIGNNPANGPAPLIQGIGTSINGVEITRTNQNGLVVNNRIYISPTTDNLTNVGHGIVWMLGGATNDTSINDGFDYLGGTNFNGINSLTTQRLNFYGIGSHIPDNRNTLSSLAGRGTYIAGYFGVDIFSGGRLKVKVDEYNDVNIFSRLNINPTGINGDYDILGSSINENRVLLTIRNQGGSQGNNVVMKDWSVRANQALTPNTALTDSSSWLTWKHHNGITIDGYYNTPNGPAKPSTPGTVDSPTYGTLTFWERHPYLHEQYFGSADRKTLTINSSVNNTGVLTSFVKVDGNLLVGSSTTQITNSTGNIVVGNGNLLVGTNTIISNVIADFTSTTKGILPPRMTTTQRGSIGVLATGNTKDGLTIYNTTTKTLNSYRSDLAPTNIATGWISYLTTIDEQLNVGTSAAPITGNLAGQSQTINGSTYGNGYLRLGNGLILQWCKLKSNAGNTAVRNYRLPIPIKTCLSLQITSDRAGAGSSGTNHGQIFFNNTTSFFDAFSATLDSAEGWMFCIGLTPLP